MQSIFILISMFIALHPVTEYNFHLIFNWNHLLSYIVRIFQHILRASCNIVIQHLYFMVLQSYTWDINLFTPFSIIITNNMNDMAVYNNTLILLAFCLPPCFTFLEEEMVMIVSFCVCSVYNTWLMMDSRPYTI